LFNQYHTINKPGLAKINPSLQDLSSPSDVAEDASLLDVMLCHWVSSYQHFEGSYCLHLQGQKQSKFNQAIKWTV